MTALYIATSRSTGGSPGPVGTRTSSSEDVGHRGQIRYDNGEISGALRYERFVWVLQQAVCGVRKENPQYTCCSSRKPL